MKVTCLTSTYNRLEMLKESVQSFLDQDYENSELIILNNGSTDGTQEYLMSIDNPRIHIVESKQNLRPPINFNVLYSFELGDLVCHLHDDDKLLNNGLSLRVKEFEKDPNLQVIYAGWITNGQVYEGQPVDKERILRDEYVNFLTLMWRKEVDMKLDEDFEHYFDWFFKIKCFQNYKVGYIPHPVLDYRLHAGQETARCRRDKMNAIEEKLMRSKL